MPCRCVMLCCLKTCCPTFFCAYCLSITCIVSDCIGIGICISDGKAALHTNAGIMLVMFAKKNVMMTQVQPLVMTLTMPLSTSSAYACQQQHTNARGKHDISACMLQACWHEEPDQRPGFESITGSLRLLLHQTAVLWSRTDRLTGTTLPCICQTMPHDCTLILLSVQRQPTCTGLCSYADLDCSFLAV